MPVTMRAISLESLDAITYLTIGIQQQKINPTTVSTIKSTIPILARTIPHIPNLVSNHPNTPWSWPALSFNSFLKRYRLYIASVNDPSGAVLFGMKVQHISPTRAKTPPFSAKSQSKACLFCQATAPVAVSCFPKADKASSV